MADTKNCQKDLLQWINIVSFTLNDIQLFLDTHPSSQPAMEYFDSFHAERKAALKEYARLYGPLTVDTVNTSACDTWNWIHSPWPWQKGGC